MDVLFVEGWDPVVQKAVIKLSNGRPGHNFRVLLKKEHNANNQNIKKSLNNKNIKCTICNKIGFEEPYKQGVKDLKTEKIDILFAGADIPHFTFLPLLFRGIGVHRKEDLLTSFTLIDTNFNDQHRQIIMLDPTVVTDPSELELCRMTKRVASLVPFLLGENPKIALISHSTGRDNKSKQSKLIECLRSQLSMQVFPYSLQLDTALFKDVAEKKMTRMESLPNLLVLPNITPANILYKSIEHFGGNKLRCSSPLLWRSPMGEVGLIPRTTTVNQILHSFDILIRMYRQGRNI